MSERVIKFRAFHKRFGRMIYFDTVDYCDEYNHLSFGVRKADLDKDGGDYANLRSEIDDFSSIMQFTGLLDSQGREIYEGDVVEITNPANQIQKMKLIGVVNFTWAAFGVKITSAPLWEGYSVPPQECGNTLFFTNIYGSKTITVTGNIYSP